MKVAILIKNLTSGGAEKQSILLAKALTDSYEVHYIIFSSKYYEPKYLALLNSNNKINVFKCNGSFASRFKQLVSYLKVQNIDCIFSYLTGANVLALFAGKIAEVKLLFPGIRNAYLPPAKAFTDRFLTNVISTKAVLNCHSGFLYFSSNGFKPEKLKVIPNCFENITDFKDKIQSENVRIISVGRFVPQKDYDTALQAIKLVKKQYPNIIYQIVGFGDLEDFIRNRVIELALTDSVEIYINPNNIPDLLNESDIYLSTSTFEGTSNSIMEAMNSDLPIVATNVGDNDQLIIGNYNGYLCTVKDAVDISNKLILLIENQRKRIEMGKASKQHLLDNFSMEKFTKSYLQLIESLL